jgi:cholesterol transport system auxiliary component
MPINRRLLLLAPLALTGCGSILGPQKYVARTDWPLAPPPPAGDGKGRGTVLVRDIEAAPGLGGRGLLTLEPDGGLHTGYYNRWAVPPAQAVTASLIAWLQASGKFAAVVPSGSALSPGLIVEGTLNTLMADLASNTARAGLTLVVAKPHGIGERPVLQRRLAARMPLKARDGAGLVAAQRAALAEVLEQAVRLVTGLQARA